MQPAMVSRPLRWLFGLALFMSTLTGFAQMPIFKRYYIADLPGLGWLAQFYTTFWLHYVSAIVCVALIAYFSTAYLLAGRRHHRLTVMGVVRGAMLAGILGTGFLLVYRNLPGYRFHPLLVVGLDFAHLGLVVLFLMASMAAKVTHMGWLRHKSPIRHG